MKNSQKNYFYTLNTLKNTTVLNEAFDLLYSQIALLLFKLRRGPCAEAAQNIKTHMNQFIQDLETQQMPASVKIQRVCTQYQTYYNLATAVRKQHNFFCPSSL